MPCVASHVRLKCLSTAEKVHLAGAVVELLEGGVRNQRMHLKKLGAQNTHKENKRGLGSNKHVFFWLV